MGLARSACSRWAEAGVWGGGSTWPEGTFPTSNALGSVELQVWRALGSAELLRKQVNGVGERALGKGDKSIRKPIFISSLMIVQEKPDEGGGEDWRETDFHYWAWREASATLHFGWLEGCVIRHLMREETKE